MSLYLFHPALVHFSVAFLISGAACELAGLMLRRPAFARVGGRLVLAGTASLVPTIVSGYLAANTVELSPEAARILESHETNGLILAGLYVACLFWKAAFRGTVPQGQRVLYAVVLAAGVLLTAYSAWLGGRMVYGEGTGVRSTRASAALE